MPPLSNVWAAVLATDGFEEQELTLKMPLFFNAIAPQASITLRPEFGLKVKLKALMSSRESTPAEIAEQSPAQKTA
jgi:hypothetical protein